MDSQIGESNRLKSGLYLWKFDLDDGKGSTKKYELYVDEPHLKTAVRQFEEILQWSDYGNGH